MEYHFDVEDAKKYGVEPAIFLYNLKFWIRKNHANGKHSYEKRTWTYNSQNAFTELFPFWSRQNIRTIIKKLVDKKGIRTGNFNKALYDKTTWFALEDEATLGWNQPTDGLESTNRSDGINQPIPDTNTDTKPDTSLMREREEKLLFTKVKDSFVSQNENSKHILYALRGRLSAKGHLVPLA